MSGKKLLIILFFLIVAVLLFFMFRPERSGRGVETKEGQTMKGSVLESNFVAPASDGKGLGPNDPPVITGLKLEFVNTAEKDILKVIPRGNAAEGKPLSFSYQWTKNGEPAGQGDTISGFKRGDAMAVTITPFDGEKHGQPRTNTTEISNTPPKIRAFGQTSADRTSITYKLDAYDPDGDAMTYSLVDAPSGVSIDQQGVIKWTFNADNQKIAFKVKITDGHGGETIYPLSLDSGKMEPVAPVKSDKK
jgi:hypothetical protein